MLRSPHAVDWYGWLNKQKKKCSNMKISKNVFVLLYFLLIIASFFFPNLSCFFKKPGSLTMCTVWLIKHLVYANFLYLYIFISNYWQLVKFQRLDVREHTSLVISHLKKVLLHKASLSTFIDIAQQTNPPC